MKIIIFFLILSIYSIANWEYDAINKINNIEQIDKLISKSNSIKNENNYNKINMVIDLLEERKKYLINSKINKIQIGITKNKTPIFAYYKWDINKNFIWFFSNIHWWYEYWTYLTAIELIKNLENSNKTQWFIIPTLNPDWLKIAQNDNFKNEYYLSWRNNSNNIDLNRNFCTNDFKITNYTKKWENFYSWNKCNQENETLAVDYTLNHFKFSEIISLHSTWKIFFIPDDSYYDKRIINLANKFKKILPDYFYSPPTNNKIYDTKIIEKIEINEWKKWNQKDFTWLMENYIYQRYNIPTLLIELEYHNKVENKLINIIQLIN